jgi:hypothetical protein
MLFMGTFFVGTSDIVSAVDLVEGDYTYNTYTTNNSVVVAYITKYIGAGGAITIPSTLGGYRTTTIVDYAFSSASVTSVIIPDSVLIIGDNAFYSCSSLNFVTIGNGVRLIGNSAFYDCASLSSVTIGNNVTIIGDSAFYGCTSLFSVIIGSNVTDISASAFGFCFSLTSITFLGLIAPTTVGSNWILSTPVEIKGHAYVASNFPVPGGVWNGLTMGTVIVGRVNKPPVARFTWAPSTPKTNQTITFDASASYNPDGSITLYEWDWNNDSTYEDSYHTPIAIKTWTRAGNYSVTLRVTDNDGVTSTKTITIPISSGGTPGFELLLLVLSITLALVFCQWKKKSGGTL